MTGSQGAADGNKARCSMPGRPYTRTLWGRDVVCSFGLILALAELCILKSTLEPGTRTLLAFLSPSY